MGNGLDKCSLLFYTFLTMLQTVRISSKRQITIPAKIFNSLGLKKGERLVVRLDARTISMQRGLDLLDELQGSLKLPQKYKGKPESIIIQDAKHEHFKHTYSQKK